MGVGQPQRWPVGLGARVTGNGPESEGGGDYVQAEAQPGQRRDRNEKEPPSAGKRADWAGSPGASVLAPTASFPHNIQKMAITSLVTLSCGKKGHQVGQVNTCAEAPPTHTQERLGEEPG